MDRTRLVEEAVAFQFQEGEYTFKATYLKEPKGASLIEIKKGEELVREFLFPSYKIWNIPARSKDIVEGLRKESDAGLRVAGSDGLGGNSYPG